MTRKSCAQFVSNTFKMLQHFKDFFRICNSMRKLMLYIWWYDYMSSEKQNLGVLPSESSDKS